MTSVPCPDRVVSSDPVSAECGSPAGVLRIGAVSFLNTVPLIDGLDRLKDVHVTASVPSRLMASLLARDVDVALCSSVDYFTAPICCPILPAGQLGCDGATMTVRLYSERPVEEVHEVWCDSDSHTSVALLRLVLRARTGRDPLIVPFHARERMANGRPMEWPPAMLLIGDKVVTDSPPAIRYPHQLDLGAAWKEMTGLPFVFGVWMVHPSVSPQARRQLRMVLDRQRRRGISDIASIVARYAVPRGWPADLATSYLQTHIRHAFTERSRIALERFGAMLVQAGIIPDARDVVLAED